MKKLCAILIMAAMLLPMLVITPSAIEIEGDWMTYRQANDYHDVDPSTGEEPAYTPAPGYEYTDEGFTTIPADYTDTCPYFNVMTKDKQSLKDGIYIKFRIDAFSYKGEDGKADEWICLSMWDSPNIAPGQSGFGSGWFGLIRGSGGGATADFCSHSITPELDDQGREIYTYCIEWDGALYRISLNGVPLTDEQCERVTNALNAANESGLFYVGISMQSTVKNGVAAMTILEYGISPDDATTPAGSDRKEPEENKNIVAEMMDPATIEENKPALYWDASLYDAPSGNGMTVDPLGDNAFRVTLTAGSGFFSWKVPIDKSYDVDDFPVLSIMFRDFWADFTVWYMCGDVVGPTNGKTVHKNVYDGIFYDGEGLEDYCMVTVNLGELADGRINGMRIDLSRASMSESVFDICYMGFFRSEEEAEAYSRTLLGVEDGNNADTEEETEVKTEEEPVTVNPETEADTSAETTIDTTVTTEKQTNVAGGSAGGCSSAMGVGLLPLVAFALPVVLKKKE